MKHIFLLHRIWPNCKPGKLRFARRIDHGWCRQHTLLCQWINNRLRLSSSVLQMSVAHFGVINIHKSDASTCTPSEDDYRVRKINTRRHLSILIAHLAIYNAVAKSHLLLVHSICGACSVPTYPCYAERSRRTWWHAVQYTSVWSFGKTLLV